RDFHVTGVQTCALPILERMHKQLRSMGAMFDWERESASCDPKYYKWTQWFFKQFYQHELAYRSEALVNWSPTLQTVLANEQVIRSEERRVGEECRGRGT